MDGGMKLKKQQPKNNNPKTTKQKTQGLTGSLLEAFSLLWASLNNFKATGRKSFTEYFTPFEHLPKMCTLFCLVLIKKRCVFGNETFWKLALHLDL